MEALIKLVVRSIGYNGILIIIRSLLIELRDEVAATDTRLDDMLLAGLIQSVESLIDDDDAGAAS